MRQTSRESCRPAALAARTGAAHGHGCPAAAWGQTDTPSGPRVGIRLEGCALPRPQGPDSSGSQRAIWIEIPRPPPSTAGVSGSMLPSPQPRAFSQQSRGKQRCDFHAQTAQPGTPPLGRQHPREEAPRRSHGPQAPLSSALQAIPVQASRAKPLAARAKTSPQHPGPSEAQSPTQTTAAMRSHRLWGGRPTTDTAPPRPR